MWSSRDLTLVIFLAVVSFVYSMLLAQLPTLITGIIGLNYFFLIGHVIIITISFLIYNGKRWRFAAQAFLLAMLFIPTNAVGSPFDFLARVPMIIVTVSADIIFNSIFNFFKLRNKLLWWVLLTNFFIHLLSPFVTAINMYFFYSPELFSTFVNVVTLLIPIIIIEIILGSYFGFQIFNRISKLEIISTTSNE